ncbi:N-acetyltransferase eco isoform X2 [Sitodiplosis mosellana]|nr:N-acetyltransferase eco isoform X2 [Sitodiplosis mosellana]XP_055312084.1 N-acetyltransferase eco isoform X2 [Sitodiplosis mosellana]
MDTTPRTRSTTRHRRAPTPKLSERKKKLFDDVTVNTKSPIMMGPFQPYVRLERIIIEEADDSDIGPMSPLEFSSSPSSFNEVHRIIAREQKGSAKSRRTNFSNVISELSKSPTNSPTRSKSGKKAAEMIESTSISESADTKDSSEEDVVGPLCTSMKKLTSMTEPNYEQQMKTPSESNASNKASGEVARGASFRKSLVFDTGLTPHDDESNAPSSNKLADNEPSERPKAKTSLTFGEPVISVRSFYGKPIEKPAESKAEMDIIAKLSSHEFAAVIAKRKNRSKPKTTTKPKSLAKRMKAPSLWRFSGKMKFNRQKQPRPHKEAKKKKEKVFATNGGSVIDTENVAPIGAEFTSRIEQNLRLQKILKDQTNAFEVSRDINWNGGNKGQNDQSPLVPPSAFLNSDGEDDADSDNESALPTNCSTYEEVEVEVETNRKFFKSSASSAKKYRIMGRLSATLKRGGDLKFDPLPKRKKKRPNKDGETVFLHNEISSIIDRLSSPSKNKRNNDASSDKSNDRHSDVTNINLDKNVEANSEKTTDVYSDTIAEANIDTNSNTENQVTRTNADATVIENQQDFIEEMQTEGPIAMEPMAYVDVNKYRQMIPYNTTDSEKISQQESILELLISNGICNDETFQIFIAEPDLHKEKASQILDSLYCVNTMMPDEYENDGTIDWVNSVESMPIALTPDSIVAIDTNSNGPSDSNLIESGFISSVVLGVAPTLGHETAHSHATDTPITDETPKESHPTEAMAKENASSEKLFPIFSKNFNAKDYKAPTFNTLNKAPKEWVAIGNQYQLDIGQKEFGLRTCAQCDMQYSVHEPEDELLHQKYHNCVNILSFKGWNNERVVTQIPDWGLNGRIIYVCETDSKAKKDRAKEVLDMVDRDLGFAARTELKPKTLVYFAIAKQQIVGVCVVQPLERAHRLKHENGIDCYTTETYPVKCGISRVWIAPQYRRHGIAAKLITSMRSHFIFGAFLSFDDIAFSSPTEDGKKFAAKLTQRTDFLIYEQ